MATLLPDVLYNVSLVEMMERINATLAIELVGKTVEIQRFIESGTQRWEPLIIEVASVEWEYNDDGWADNDGPQLTATDGNVYSFHPQYGIKIIG